MSNGTNSSNRGNNNQRINRGTYFGNDFCNNNNRINDFQQVQITSLIENSYSRSTSMLNDVQNKQEKNTPQNNVRTSLLGNSQSLKNQNLKSGIGWEKK